ncbi:desiccation-related protein PCC13-62-like [Populus alba x Populus x berolinensis]|nr:desiccation-related protein PCC13-62-like [Populus alba x Populus x berolinensis]
MATLYFLSTLVLTIVVSVPINVLGSAYCGPVEANDQDLIQFALNLEFLEAELFLNSALGHGLDAIDPVTRRIIEEFAYQEVGHLRAIITTVGGVSRPLYDLSPEAFAQLFDKAVGYKLDPPFNPYSNTVNYLLASYVIPYVGLVAYVGTIPPLANYTSRRLVASLLGVESGQDAVIRTLLYEKAYEKVLPYNITVAEFTNAISCLRNELAMCGIRDEGLIVPLQLGAENRTESNILSADANSLSYARTQPQILRIIYGTGSEYKPGGFLPKGGNGKIARSFLEKFNKAVALKVHRSESMPYVKEYHILRSLLVKHYKYRLFK